MSLLRFEIFKSFGYYKDLAEFVNVNNIKKEDILSIVPIGGGLIIYYYKDDL